MPITSTAYRSALHNLRRCAAPDAEDALQTAVLELLALPEEPVNVAGWLVYRARQRLCDAHRGVLRRARVAAAAATVTTWHDVMDTRDLDVWLLSRTASRVGVGPALERALAPYEGPSTSAQRVARLRATREVRAALEGASP